MWITNGPEWRGTGSMRYSNGLTVEDCQFNQGLWSIIDDGGNMHIFQGNNINDSANGVWLAGVTGLTYVGNAHEGLWAAGKSNVTFSNVDALTGLNTKDPCKGFTVSGNTFSQMTTADGPMLKFSGDMHRGGKIFGNYFATVNGGERVRGRP